MIKANELRIGNIIRFHNRIEPERFIKINAKFFSSLAGGRPLSELKDDEEINGYHQPIELTPDILEAAGFGVNKDNSFGYVNENEGILIELGDFDEEFGRRVFYYVLPDTDDYTCIAYCKHLHQLQNLYFALTGEELKIDITKLNKEK